MPADECVQRRVLYTSRSVFSEKDVERRASRAFKRATYKAFGSRSKSLKDTKKTAIPASSPANLCIRQTCIPKDVLVTPTGTGRVGL